ncbi:MAG: DUF1987 domain-containing protein [Tenuifilaceae bacterium]|jgi:hypothetical protein|nr:DUF1987 domain-containing protein [Bacteroidales bacterium]MDI9517422.1 DUF1987 domain-containing protein [Bacteroidota bacterium]NLH56372.1 DUF1987 domain-containing protein [Rikenellaceae bacterium]OQC61441.1 MAG: hypothetical protein BWX49_02291 [Bacteroidetes bacterium ADurb.Bin008]HNV80241.1 DUF1987 domain-containing protein [Tenuifilaceae bacterium]
MERFFLKPTNETPRIELDKVKNIFEISGTSLPEDVVQFYTPVLTWLNQYSSNPNEKTVVKFSMDYYNTSSSKMILKILELFKDIYRKGFDVEIHWHYFEDDEDIIEAGEDYSETIKIPFKFFSRTR